MSATSKTLPGGLDLSSIPPFSRAQGAFVFDSAGTPYLDLISGYGTVIAGHANEAVVDEVAKTLHMGNYLYGHHDLISSLTKRLNALFPPTTSVLYFKTGSEAVQCATRLVRAATGRERILRCGFHGWHDQFMTENVSWHDFGRKPVFKGRVAGVPTALWSAATRVTLDEESLDTELRKGDVAALILDPVQLVPPYREQLEGIRELCRAHGALLIIDESKTGFRVSPAGVQGLVDIYGDVTILSKALANGFPLAAVLMSDYVRGRSLSAKIMGTYNEELSALAAAKATLNLLFEKEAWQELNELGEWLLKRVNDGLTESGCRAFSLVGFRWPSMPALIHIDDGSGSSRKRLSAVAQRLLERHILWLPHHMNFLSLAHSRDLLEGFADSLIVVCMEVECANS
ncbi:MAG: aminotransferase class III-fold pyridoxal phosphate-dependent enzyme [Chitinophagaceae bacterium]